MLNNLIILAVAAAIGYFFWRMMRPKYAVRIVVNQQKVQHHEGLPMAQQKNVLEFLEEQLHLDGKLTICAIRQPGGHLRITFRGSAHPGTQQQIRNFLNSVL